MRLMIEKNPNYELAYKIQVNIKAVLDAREVFENYFCLQKDAEFHLSLEEEVEEYLIRSLFAT